MLKVAVCGGSGYAGAELLRILLKHPKVKVTAVTSERSAGKTITQLFPHLRGYEGLTYEPLDKESLAHKADLFFLALPHGGSQEAVDYFLRKDKAVIDLSADYRLRDWKTYEYWYKTPHAHKDTLKKAVYGMPELYRSKIKKSRLIANPGCYPTGAVLGLYPALKKGLVNPKTIIIDSKSGVSGAGRKSDVAYSYCEVNEGFKAYAVASHRHTPEIEQELSAIAKKSVVVNFTPHLVPIDRGILTTIYVSLKKNISTERVLAAYRALYANEPFVSVLPAGVLPNVKNVRGTNMCEIGLVVDKRTDRLIVVTAIDNLTKGAAGTAVHNMNIMYGFEEATALDKTPAFP